MVPMEYLKSMYYPKLKLINQSIIATRYTFLSSTRAHAYCGRRDYGKTRGCRAKTLAEEGRRKGRRGYGKAGYCRRGGRSLVRHGVRGAIEEWRTGRVEGFLEIDR